MSQVSAAGVLIGFVDSGRNCVTLKSEVAEKWSKSNNNSLLLFGSSYMDFFCAPLGALIFLTLLACLRGFRFGFYSDLECFEGEIRDYPNAIWRYLPLTSQSNQ